MENMQYAEELVKEFLVFRGFTSTLQAFERELGTDIGKGFQVDKILELIFSVYIPQFRAEDLIEVLSFFKQCFSSSSETLLISTLSKLENFSLADLRIPAILKICSEKITVNRLKKDIRQLNLRLSELQALLEEKEAQLCRSRSYTSSPLEASVGQKTSPTNSVTWTPLNGGHEADIIPPRVSHETGAPLSTPVSEQESPRNWAVTGPAEGAPKLASSKVTRSSSSKMEVRESGRINDPLEMIKDGFNIETSTEMQEEEEFPEVKVEFQETFLGHTSPITRCRFSASGNNIASASVDGTVRIWTYDSATPASRNATIYCGAEIMSLEWDCKSDRLLLIGTADGGIKAWNVDAKRVVCDLKTIEAFPSVLDLKCSPVEPIFVSAASSKGHGTSYMDKLGFANLTVWNMKTWKAMTVLPLGEDPPAITSLCFNHNGKILAAAATDGMIHMFGILVVFIFMPDESQTPWFYYSWFCNHENSGHCRHEMALDADGRRLLVTSGSVRAPIYQVRGHMNGVKTLPHSAAITTVDWHPTLPLFLTGSADHSVRVTSIL
ncbi:hypothetical protein RHMOL_Rhmol03G0222200 [Rhododendron molle]|uniref:Uncharacterized protein n=1 Tax=Rhododendron molle TaxID=49168 RepID=A0ACC0PIL2_RHOML|nr:hypothetical protein RHMOL_Rhmol03G0222200 [Rhododendron molle]